MRTAFALLAIALSACAEINLATSYTKNKPQTFETSIPGLEISSLKVYRSDRHPGKLWVSPSSAKGIALAFSERSTQFTAMLSTVVEPAYRDAAIRALKENPGGSCEITTSVPWPTQFAIEFAFLCD